MDSTALRSAMRALTRLGIVVESISKFARELERYHPGLHEQISKEVIRRYVDREGIAVYRDIFGRWKGRNGPAAWLWRARLKPVRRYWDSARPSLLR